MSKVSKKKVVKKVKGNNYKTGAIDKKNVKGHTDMNKKNIIKKNVKQTVDIPHHGASETKGKNQPGPQLQNSGSNANSAGAKKSKGVKRKLDEASVDRVVNGQTHHKKQKKMSEGEKKQGSNSGDLKENKVTPQSTKLKVPPFSAGGDQNWKALLLTLPKEEKKKAKQVIPRYVSKKIHHKGKQAEKKEKPKTTSGSPEIWFDDVDEFLLEGVRDNKTLVKADVTEEKNPLVKEHSLGGGLTKVVAMDCEMVGVGDDGKDSVLARVSIVNQFGHVVLDKYVKPTEPVTDYRTHVSGIRPEDLQKADEFIEVQKEVSNILKGRILVGHALNNDLQVLYLSHPRRMIRDTARYKPFRVLFSGRIPSLKKLTAKLLSVEVQTGEHSSVQDAQAAMRIYTMHRKDWEKAIKEKGHSVPIASKKKPRSRKPGKDNVKS